jgi:glycine oxidase
MTLKGLRVVVAGAGAIGSVLALRLAQSGAEVVLADPAPLGDNASGVAAGMLAPAFETLLDGASADFFDLLRTARDAWPAFLQPLGKSASLDCSGALLRVADRQMGERLLDQMRALGGGARLIADAEARTLAPGLSGGAPFLFTPDDWRIEARPTLSLIQDAFVALGGRLAPSSVVAFAAGQARLEKGETILCDIVVLCTGLQAAGWAHGRDLVPIKGQIIRFDGHGPRTGPVVRAGGMYVAPSARGALAGATMEPGRSDLTIDKEAVEGLRAAAVALYPHLARARPEAFAGVRATTPDGLPLVGGCGQEGVLVARGARRNGWLLAPLVAEVIIDRLQGRSSSAASRAFDPDRIG